jgi:hypothetical protein
LTGALALAAVAFAVPAGFVPLRASPTVDDSVPMKDVPDAVRATAEKKYGALDKCKASREKEHGKVRWEIERPADGGGVESLIITDAGDLVEVEKPVAPDHLPKVIRDALAQAYPKGEIVVAESVETHLFEVALKVDGKTHHVKVELDGALPAAHAAAKTDEKEKGEKAKKSDDDDDDENEGGGNWRRLRNAR